MHDHEAFAVLGLARDASEAEIKSGYRARLMLAHPDHGGTPRALARVLEAWKVLRVGASARRRCHGCGGVGRVTRLVNWMPLVSVCARCAGTGVVGN